MSSMFKVTIESIQERAVKMNVVSVHPDSGPPPAEKNFALQMVVELYWLLKKEY